MERVKVSPPLSQTERLTAVKSEIYSVNLEAQPGKTALVSKAEAAQLRPVHERTNTFQGRRLDISSDISCGRVPPSPLGLLPQRRALISLRRGANLD